ncbi:metallophosphoesterase [Methanobacterium ferruginis]|uniref:metallophosphoesterase n=1 Tax=Methanobacterium ferruginis TaxID=710191 RepID=UPI002572E27A|nr:metallophosphoesterase family protein [Methanobacterium ferruginis]BDZ69285.1 UDP-2,3-diacylglucosamine hydrolase [Methanobacterium ferruginis]
MILVVSDVHLGFEKSNRDAFLNFLDTLEDVEIEHLVLLGDILDLWRRNNAEIIKENNDILFKLNSLNADEIHYIAGNHDYYILDLNKRYYTFDSGKKYNIDNKVTISKSLRLKSGKESFFFIHGYELEAQLWEFPGSIEMYEEFNNEMCYNKDTVGALLSKIWEAIGFITKKQRFMRTMTDSPLERENANKLDEFATFSGKNFLLGMRPDENLVFGHTHRPFIDKDRKVANTGSWIDELPEKDKQNSYIQIDKGKMELNFFK